MNFDVKVFTLPVPEPYKTQARELGSICFSNPLELPHERKEEQDRFCSQSDWYRFVFAIEDNKVIGSITTLKRTILFQGKEVLLGGIGGVSTQPDKRNQGVASAMLRVAMDELKLAGCDIAYLCTDVKNPARLKLYGKFGFGVLNGHVTYLGKSGKRYLQKEAMIASVNSDALFDAVMQQTQPLDIGTGDW